MRGKFLKEIAALSAVAVAVGTVTAAPKISGDWIFGTGVSAVDNVSTIAVNDVNFPDNIFRQYVLDNCDTDKDGVLSEDEINEVTLISTYEFPYNSIQSLKGVEYFTKLTFLDCTSNKITTLDISRNSALERLFCNGNQLTSLDISNNPALERLFCGSNQLTSLDVSNNSALLSLYCPSNQLTSLDVSNNYKLTELWCSYNHLTSLDISNNSALTELGCGYNQLTSLNVGNNSALTELVCDGNQLTSLNVGNN